MSSTASGITGLVFITAGFGLFFLGLLGVIDPVGAKMSDDADPFGPTDGIVARGIVLMVISIGMMLGGTYLLWRSNRER
jgi:hypothetical protein